MSRPRARRHRVLVSAAALLVVAACTSDQPPSTSEAPSDGTTPDETDTDEPEPPEDEAGDEPAGEETDEQTADALDACGDDLTAELDAVVAGQLDAFAASDYELALSFASDGFRAGVTAEQLRRIIEQGFPVAADAEDHTSSGCRVQPASPDHPAAAVLDVVVTATDGATSTLRYLFSLDADGWGVAAAQPIDGGDGGIVAL